ncbi:hypothetical protein NC652_038606 [Populus alba x Populus x berolinensis]|nr:hypothetical protein NC652_038606 [Populus alba x Populus x berolinensis]
MRRRQEMIVGLGCFSVHIMNPTNALIACLSSFQWVSTKKFWNQESTCPSFTFIFIDGKGYDQNWDAVFYDSFVLSDLHILERLDFFFLCFLPWMEGPSWHFVFNKL